MIAKSLILAAALALSTSAFAEEPIRIEVGRSYEKYSNEELRRRVWQLERAVEQLQRQVFELAVRPGSPPSNTVMPPVTGAMWTCQMQSFGKTHVSSGVTKASALAQVLKKCSDATNAIHCKESDVKCDNE